MSLETNGALGEGFFFGRFNDFRNRFGCGRRRSILGFGRCLASNRFALLVHLLGVGSPFLQQLDDTLALLVLLWCGGGRLSGCLCGGGRTLAGSGGRSILRGHWLCLFEVGSNDYGVLG